MNLEAIFQNVIVGNIANVEAGVQVALDAGMSSEEILGKLISDCRDEVIITSKVYFPMGDDINARGATRRHMMRAVEASLKRLQTDAIDVYFIHRFDDRTLGRCIIVVVQTLPARSASE